MSKIVKVFQNSMKRSKMVLIAALICGLLLCIIYSLISDLSDAKASSISIGINDKDKTASSKEFARYVREDLGMEVFLEDNGKILNNDLLEKKVSAIVEVPQGFETALIEQKERPLEIYFTDDYANSAFISGYLDVYMDSAKTLALASEGNAAEYLRLVKENRNEKPEIKVTATDKDARIKAVEKTGLDVTMGFFLMVSFILALGFSSMVFTDRKEGTFNRVKVTDVKTIQYMTGMCLTSIVCSMLLIAPFLLFVTFSGIHLELSIAAITFLCLIFALIVVGLALFVAMLLNSRNSIMAGIVGFTTVTCILGGAFFPIDYAPEFLQQMAKITPQYWFMDAIRIILDGSSGDWLLNAVILIMFAVLFFVLAGVRFATSRAQVQ